MDTLGVSFDRLKDDEGLASPKNNAGDVTFTGTTTAPVHELSPVQGSTWMNPPSTRIEGMEALDELVAGDGGEEITAEELSFYSASDNQHGDDNIWGLLSGIGGNIYEWYDFAVYGLLAPEIGAAFFPDSSEKLQLINSFGVYLAAFLMRPIGAIFFGEIGDRIVGRKHALVFSILLITVPSVLMGILPAYNTLGVAAPIILVLLRMMQGLSVGGQLAGSYVISIEQASSKSRGFRGSICDASSVGGFMLASAVTSTVRVLLTDQQVHSWGWRLPFLFSLLLAPILYFIVGHAEESKHWEERNEQKQTEETINDQLEEYQKPAFMDLLGSPFRRRQLALMVGVLCAVSSSFYILFLWTPVYLSELRGIMPRSEADGINFIVVGCYICFLVLAGKVSDGFQHRLDLVRIGLPGIIVACPTMFAIFETNTWWGTLISQLLFAACLSLIQGSMAAFEVELWMDDPTLSFTGVAIGHNVASTLFGGTMPLAATFLFYLSNHMIGNDQGRFYNSLVPRLLPGLYVSILGMVSLACTFLVRHPHDVRIAGPKLKAAVEIENKKLKAAMKAKKKRKKDIQNDLISSSSPPPAAGGHYYIPPMV